MFTSISFGLRVAALTLILSVNAAHAHDGHDHGSEAIPAPTHVLPRGEASSAEFEIVVVAASDHLTIYLDQFATNAPLSSAEIEVETPQGPVKATAQPDGVYTLKAPWLLTQSGHADVALTVTAGAKVDIFSIGIDIPAAHQSGANASSSADVSVGHGWLDKLAAPMPWIMLAGGLIVGVFAGRVGTRRQALLAIFTAAAIAASHDRSLAHDGHDEIAPASVPAQADRAQREPDGTIFVPKSVQRIFVLRTQLAQSGRLQRTIELPGRIIPDPNATGYVQTALGGRLSPPPGGFPRLGTAVTAGDVLGYVTPPVQTVDVSDMRQRQGELDQQIAIVERRLGRYEQLTTTGAISRTQLEETRLELQGLRDRRQSLDRVRQDSEALLAPVSGVIAEGTPIAGQIVQTTQVILQIYDPKKLWVEALSFDVFGDLREATARGADGTSVALIFRGAGSADRSQSFPIHFAIEGDPGSVRTGQFVTVFAARGEMRSGIALPRTAVVRATNGQEHVFEQVSAERFVSRIVRTEPLDGERIVILTGIEAGRRIVVQGAELLDHIR
jgi:hypothetical protein